MNQVFLYGNIGKDPETRQVGDNTVCGFSLATNKNYKDNRGEWQQDTQWHSIICWNRLADKAAKFEKGTKCLVQGALKYSSWEDQNGNTRYKTEVIATKIEAFMPKVENNSVAAPPRVDEDNLPF